MMARSSLLKFASLCVLLAQVSAIGQQTCVSFSSSSSTFSVVSNKKAAPILISPDEWPGVQRTATDFVADIQRVTGVTPSLTNVTSTNLVSAAKGSSPIIVGTLGKSSLISQVVNNTKLDVSSIEGKWEAFMALEVKNPLPGVASAYVVIGSDKRGTIFALYDHSEQFGVSPWYWWADVPTTQHSELFVASSGCSHGSPTVKYRGIFLNDEQPALQNWAMAKFTNGTGAPLTGSPFDSMFYTKLFELLLRFKANYLWPAIWSSAFAVDDPKNQPLADLYGIVMGTSHQEPMMRSTPIEFSLFAQGPWDYTTNAANINEYWLQGTERAKPYESVYTIGMRGFGDLPLSVTTDISLLEEVIANQTQILQKVYNETDVSNIPQIWALYKEVEGYYDDGMRVPDYVTLLWTDDNWGNIRRFPVPSERNRTGGAGVYYHLDYVGDPRDYKWITSSQIEKIRDQMSIAVDRKATQVWILNVGDLKPYERETEFFISYGWNSSVWNQNNVGNYVTAWAEREFDLTPAAAGQVTQIVANLTRFNARRKPELLNSTTYSLTNYREASTVQAQWSALQQASTAIYNSLSKDAQTAFFQLVQHPVLASSNLGNMLISAGMNNLRASQAFYTTNSLADTVEALFENDFALETQYDQLNNGKWSHMMDQTHLGYYYWQQPMTNTMPMVSRVQKNKVALAGIMRLAPEGTLGAWPGDNPNQCAQGFSCPPPSVTLDNFNPFGNFYFDVGAGGPTPFTFTITSNASWLTFTPSKGTITPSSTPEQRVFASVSNWNSLPAGASEAAITFTANAAGQTPFTTTATLTAQKNVLPSSFKGFVEGTRVISIEAAHATRKTTVDGVTWTELPGYGRTLSGVTPLPQVDNNFTVGAGPALEYDFYNFNTIDGQNITVTTFLSPSLNANGVDRPLTIAIQVDSLAPQTVQPIPNAAPGAEPAQWDGNDGFVADSIVPISNTFAASPGAHTLKIWMTEPTVIVQKIVINAGGLQPSYLGPPESIVVN